MAHVHLPNGAKVWVGTCTADTTLNELIAIVNDGLRPEKRVKACHSLASMGLLAKDAAPSLESIVHTAGDLMVINAALDALERIMPDKFTYQHKNSSRSGATDRIRKLGGHVEFCGPFAAERQPFCKKEKKKKEEVPPPPVLTKVDIVQKDTVSLEAEVRVTRKCNFCEKETPVESDNRKILERLSAPKKFYCNFCLRHQLNARDSRNVMIMSFRGVIGYFYYEFYHFPKIPAMWLSEIRDHVDLHVEIGERNPVFSYDPESMNWFIDFRRVGDSKKKISAKDVKATVIEILASFNLASNTRGVQMHMLYEKYEEAVQDFYQKRYRPAGKRICVPTLQGCGAPDWGGGVVVNPHTQNTNKLALADTKNFNPSLISAEKFWSKTAHL